MLYLGQNYVTDLILALLDRELKMLQLKCVCFRAYPSGRLRHSICLGSSRGLALRPVVGQC